MESVRRVRFGAKVRAATGVLWGLGRSLRVTWYHEDALDDIGKKSPGGVIYAFWHQRLLPFCYTHRQRGVCVLVSTHRDGELIAQVIERLGFDTIRGSSTRGGRKALHGMIALGRQGHDLAVTPDGPRGPRYVLKPGLVTLARMTGLPVIPIANAAWPRLELRSWDRFHVPSPGARCAVVLGRPWWPGEFGKDEREAARRQLELRLIETTAEADRLVGAPIPMASDMPRT